MGRLIVGAVLLCIVVLVVAVALLPAGASARPRQGPSDLMPGSFRTIAYVMLVILLLGITTGWMGAV